MAEEPSLSYYLPIAGGRIIGFIPFPRVLVLCEMQSVSSRIWTRIAVFISYGDNDYTTDISINRVSGISTRTMHQSTTPSLSQTIWPRWASRHFFTLPIVQTLLPVTFGYSLSSRKNLEAVVMRQLRGWERLWRRSLTRSHKRTSMEPSRSCWNNTTNALQPEEIPSKGTRVSCVYYP